MLQEWSWDHVHQPNMAWFVDSCPIESPEFHDANRNQMTLKSRQWSIRKTSGFFKGGTYRYLWIPYTLFFYQRKVRKVVGIRLGSNSKTTLLWHNSPWCFLKSLNNHITIFNEPLKNHHFDGLTHSVFMAITGTYRWGIYSMSTTLPPSARDQRHSARASGRCRQPHLLLQCLWPARCIFERLGDGGWVLFEWGFGHCLFASCVPTWSNCLLVLVLC